MQKRRETQREGESKDQEIKFWVQATYSLPHQQFSVMWTADLSPDNGPGTKLTFFT